MDLEIIENISTNGTFDPDTEYHLHRNHHVDTLITFFGLISIIASTIIIINIRRYQVLRTRTNAYVCNFCLANIIYLLFSPLFLNLFGLAEVDVAKDLCIVDETLMLLHLTQFAIATALILDWYIITYKSYRVSAKCTSNYTLILTTIWLLVLTQFATICIQCAAGISLFPVITIIAVFCYFYFFILVFFIHISKFCRQSNSNNVQGEAGLELEIGTLFWLCWLPNFTLYITLPFAYYHSLDYELFTYCIAHTYPIILLTLLYFKDRYFRICCKNLFKSESLEVDALEAECGGGSQKQRFTLFV